MTAVPPSTADRMKRYLSEYAVMQAALGTKLATPGDPWAGLLNLEIAEDIRKFLNEFPVSSPASSSPNNKRFVFDFVLLDGQPIVADLETGATLTITGVHPQRTHEYARNLCEALNEGKGVLK